MKKTLIVAALLLSFLGASAQDMKDVKFQFTEASTLTMAGKMFNDDPNPYHRINLDLHKGFVPKEQELLRTSTGLSVAFRTNSPIITVRTKYISVSNSGTSGAATRGYDLYIKKDGKWLWAGMCCPSPNARPYSNSLLITNMDNSMKECLMYLPLYSEEESIQIGTQEGSVIEAGEQPFRHRVGIYGSSFTHGHSTSRAGLTYPALLSRWTGIQIVNLACSGCARMQPYFAEALASADVDAYIFDTFSNGDAKSVKANLFPFIETLQKAHPGVPIIFQRTIWRERNNFNSDIARKEAEKLAMADSLMKIACKKYKDVYYVTTNATTWDHETTLDGTHPCDHGYYLWAESICKPVQKILKKYGIK